MKVGSWAAIVNTFLLALCKGNTCAGRCDLTAQSPLLNAEGLTKHQVMMRLMEKDFAAEQTRRRVLQIKEKDIVGTGLKCINGFAGEYPCSNVRAVEDVLGNDIWGWTDPRDGREYAIVCQSDGTTFVDISDPYQPRIMGRLLSHSSRNIWRDAKVYANHAFIVSEAYKHGVQSFDLMQLRDLVDPGPNKILLESGHLAKTGRCHNIVINEESATAFCVGSVDVCKGGLYMIDLADPKNPKFTSCYKDNGYVHDAQCVNYRGPDVQFQGHEICFCYNEDHLAIVDITNRANPTTLSKSTYNMSSYTHQGWLLENQAFLLLDDELDEKQGTSIYHGKTTTYVWDVTSLKFPRWSSTHISPVTSIDHNLYVLGDFAYMANYASGLRIVDVSRVPQGISKEVAYFDVRPEDNSVEFNGAWSVYPFFKSGNIIVNSIERGLFVLRANL